MYDKAHFKVNDLRKGYGYVNTIGTFNKNIPLIRPNYLEELKKELADTGKEQVIRFEVAGRYVVLVAMSKSFDVVQMIFFDLKKDDEIARMVINKIINKETDKTLVEKIAEDFIFAFKRCNLTYDEYYDLVDLSIDISEMN